MERKRYVVVYDNKPVRFNPQTGRYGKKGFTVLFHGWERAKEVQSYLRQLGKSDVFIYDFLTYLQSKIK